MPQVFHPVGSGAETCRHAFLYADLEVVVEHYVPCTRNALGHVVVKTLPADEDGHVVAREDDFGKFGALRKRHGADRSYAVAELNGRYARAVERKVTHLAQGVGEAHISQRYREHKRLKSYGFELVAEFEAGDERTVIECVVANGNYVFKFGYVREIVERRFIRNEVVLHTVDAYRRYIRLGVARIRLERPVAYFGDIPEPCRAHGGAERSVVSEVVACLECGIAYFSEIFGMVEHKVLERICIIECTFGYIAHAVGDAHSLKRAGNVERAEVKVAVLHVIAVGIEAERIYVIGISFGSEHICEETVLRA